jgi:DNA-3-methyladenine glycosylase
MKRDSGGAGHVLRVAGKPLPRSFYQGSPELVAREILGKVLVATAGSRQRAGRIVEVEAYHGADDPAAHAFTGITPRNAVLFGPPGHAYVYFIYGMHSCLNVACEPEGRAGCILVRALEPLSGIDEMRQRRGLGRHAPLRQLTSGPGRLCQAFGITRATHNGMDLTSAASELQIVEDGFRAGNVVVSPRIGIRKAAERPLRFFLADNEFVSGRRSRAGQ